MVKAVDKEFRFAYAKFKNVCKIEEDIYSY
jgi:hypothetical protein